MKVAARPIPFQRRPVAFSERKSWRNSRMVAKSCNQMLLRKNSPKLSMLPNAPVCHIYRKPPLRDQRGRKPKSVTDASAAEAVPGKWRLERAANFNENRTKVAGCLLAGCGRPCRDTRI